MKRFICFVLSVFMILSLVACGGDASTTQGGAGGESQQGGDGNTYELALITDVGTIDDKSFNQGSWEGLQAYGQDNGLTYTYYKPTEKSDDAYLDSISLAVKGQAKVVVCPGYLFENAVYEAQTRYPDVKFIILDGEPKSGAKYSAEELAANPYPDIEDNTLSIYYAEEEAGFLAGYAAVIDGNRSLGFMGGLAVPAVIRFGYGFVQGADYAAQELGLSAGEVTVKYTYVGNFDASPENMAKASSWFNEGVEVIFACGGGVGNSVMKAAETAGTKVIGVDVDQAGESETVMTSAMKSLDISVYSAIESFYNGDFEGGKSVTFASTSNGVQLPMDTSRFETFDQAAYDAIYAKLPDLTLTRDSDVSAANEIATAIVSVDVIN